MMDGRSEASGGFQALLAGKSLALLVAQHPPQPLEVGGQYRQRHGAGKTPFAVISNPVQSAVFQMIDRRLNPRVLLTGLYKPLLQLVLQSLGAQVALARQRTFVQHLSELELIVRRVKTAVETAGDKFRKQLLRLCDQALRMVHIAAVPHDAVIQDEPVLVLDYRNRQTELLRDTGLAFRNPAGMGLKDRQHFLLVGNLLTVDHAPDNLVNLALRMLDKELKFHGFRILNKSERTLLSLAQRQLGTRQIFLAFLHILDHPLGRLFNLLGGAHPVEPFLDQLLDILVLPPAVQPQILGQPGCGPDRAAHGICQQVDISRDMLSLTLYRVTNYVEYWAYEMTFH